MNNLDKALQAAVEPLADEIIALEHRINNLNDKAIPEVMVKRLDASKAVCRAWLADFVYRSPQQTSKGSLPTYLKEAVS